MRCVCVFIGSIDTATCNRLANVNTSIISAVEYVQKMLLKAEVCVRVCSFDTHPPR